MEHIYANLTVSISEFKKSPTALLDKSNGKPVALLNHNKPTAYVIPAKLYEQIIEALDDQYLLELATIRLKGERSTGQAPWYLCRPKGRVQAVFAPYPPAPNVLYIV